MEELRSEDLEERVQELAEECGSIDPIPRKVRVCPKCGKHNLESAWHCSECAETLSIETLVDIEATEQALQQHSELTQAAESALRREGPETISQQEGEGVGWVFWLLWVIASAAGLVLGSVLESVFTIDLSAHMLLGGGTTGVLGGLAVPGGLVVGTCQWLVLRRELDRAGWWILASTPMLIMGQLSSFQAGLAVRGIGVGLAQWFVLRLQVPRAGWWILVCVLGWTIGMAVGNAVAWEAGWFLANALAGAVAGAITGAGLVWLLRQ
jgi:hypothetical protein